MTADSGLPFSCCVHCGCGTPDGEWPEREGHDDICRHGCNDSELLAPEIVAANRRGPSQLNPT